MQTFLNRFFQLQNQELQSGNKAQGIQGNRPELVDRIPAELERLHAFLFGPIDQSLRLFSFRTPNHFQVHLERGQKLTQVIVERHGGFPSIFFEKFNQPGGDHAALVRFPDNLFGGASQRFFEFLSFADFVDKFQVGLFEVCGSFTYLVLQVFLDFLYSCDVPGDNRNR
jgi:hypothetical protein